MLSHGQDMYNTAFEQCIQKHAYSNTYINIFLRYHVLVTSNHDNQLIV